MNATPAGGPDDGLEPVPDPAKRAAAHRLIERVYGLIQRAGFVVMATEDAAGVEFSYTVGMTEHGLPELVVSSQTRPDGGHMLLELGKRQRRAGAFTPGGVTVFEGDVWRFDERPTLLSMALVEIIYGDNLPIEPTALTLTRVPGGA